MVSITSISACIDFRVLKRLNIFVAQALLNLEELSRSGFIYGMSSGAHGVVPGRLLRAEEVAVDCMFNIVDYGPGLLLIRISVLIPSVEAGLIPGVIKLTVMD